MAELNFDELLAKRAQREHDKTKTCKIHVPNTDDYLVATMPSDYKIMKWLGLTRSDNTDDLFEAIDDALYTCCPALQDQRLREQFDVKIPTEVVSKLFGVGERNKMGYELMKFVGVFQTTENENGEKGEDIIKN